ncbi:MAG TPA: hypothetical protein VM345_07915 [Acidimicrobiales bacterium]|nr:hypothetical protein [Acidimicrobiales bacterium]
MAAGLAAGAALLGATTLVASPAEHGDTAPAVEFRAATTDDVASGDAAGDVSGPCDEAENVHDARCVGGAGGSRATDATAAVAPDPSSSTSTTTRTSPTSSEPAAPAAPGASGSRSVDAAGAGTVVYTFSGTTFTLVSATPAAGWAVEIERARGNEIDLDFRSGTRRVQVDIELEDGRVRERVRFRDDATREETRTEEDDDDRSGDDD